MNIVLLVGYGWLVSGVVAGFVWWWLDTVFVDGMYVGGWLICDVFSTGIYIGVNRLHGIRLWLCIHFVRYVSGWDVDNNKWGVDKVLCDCFYYPGNI